MNRRGRSATARNLPPFSLNSRNRPNSQNELSLFIPIGNSRALARSPTPVNELTEQNTVPDSTEQVTEISGELQNSLLAARPNFGRLSVSSDLINFSAENSANSSQSGTQPAEPNSPPRNDTGSALNEEYQAQILLRPNQALESPVTYTRENSQIDSPGNTANYSQLNTPEDSPAISSVHSVHSSLAREFPRAFRALFTLKLAREFPHRFTRKFS